MKTDFFCCSKTKFSIRGDLDQYVHHEQDNSLWHHISLKQQLGLTGVIEKHQVSPNGIRLY